MKYRRIQYAVRTTIARDKWRVAIYIEPKKPIERTVNGSKREAEAAAKVMIDRLLKPSERDKKVKRRELRIKSA
jgi:hypothetical protein